MAQKQKILFCGDVEGKFKTLFNRIETINRKSGPFDYLFCVGNFFGVNNKEFEPYRDGQKTIPIPTYILGPNSPDHVDLYPQDDAIELCNNLYCLGKRGVFTDSKGMKVAYISGLEGNQSTDYEYSSQDIMEVYNACVRGNPTFRGVDILLTAQWPRQITNEDPKEVVLSVDKTSDLPSWLLMKIKPRYHISGLEGIYYERPPFRAPNLNDHDTTLDMVTRFLGVARVGNPNKDKWIYALNLAPLEHMKISELFQKSTDETACPFNFAELDRKVFNVKETVTKQQQYFYDMDANPTDTGRKKKRQKIEFDQDKCWFCLASPSVEKHLIVLIGETSYLALAKGGITNEHFLICPIQHYQNSLSQPELVKIEIEKFKGAITKFYGRNSEVPVFFERNYKTSHMQIQCIGVKQELKQTLQETFLKEAQSQALALEVLDDGARIDQVLKSNCPYFTVELPNGEVLYTRIKGTFPLNFGRKVLVSKRVLNMVDREDWKDCILKKPDEEALIQRLRTEFAPFDFTED